MPELSEKFVSFMALSGNSSTACLRRRRLRLQIQSSWIGRIRHPPSPPRRRPKSASAPSPAPPPTSHLRPALRPPSPPHYPRCRKRTLPRFRLFGGRSDAPVLFVTCVPLVLLNELKPLMRCISAVSSGVEAGRDMMVRVRWEWLVGGVIQN